jgi:hypothetical protein
MRHIGIAAFSIAMALSQSAFAGVKVLGFEIGVSTVSEVEISLKKQTKVEDAGTNKFSNGKMLKTNGVSYEIDGLNSVTYIFDDQNKLMGVIMDMSKHKFDSVNSYLSSKYKLVSQQRPFVGDQFARFKAENVTIEESAPHMGFNMEVRYVRNDLLAKFNQKTAKEEQQKKSSELSKF